MTGGLHIVHRATGVTIAVKESTGLAARATPTIIPCGARMRVLQRAVRIQAPRRTWSPVAHPIGTVPALILSVTTRTMAYGAVLESVTRVKHAKRAMMASTGRVARVTQRCTPAMNLIRVTVSPIAVPMDGICSWAI